MKLLKYTLLLLPVILYSQEGTFENIAVNHDFLFYETKKEQQKAVLKELDGYFSKVNIEENFFWENPVSSFFVPYIDLSGLRQKAKEGYMPTVLAMNFEGNDCYVTLAWLGETEYTDRLYVVYTLIVNQNLRFENIFNKQKDNFVFKKMKDVTYYGSDKKYLKRTDMRKAEMFNKKMAAFFEIPQLAYTYSVFADYVAMKNRRGFRFDTDMALGGKYGGETFPGLKIIFSGNGSSFYPHEVVHLYTYEKFKNKHHVMDEGLATYLGGAQGLSFYEYMEGFYRFTSKNPINLVETFREDKWLAINDTITFQNAFGALLCYVIHNRFGKTVLFELIGRGKSSEELLLAVKNIIGVTNGKELNGYLHETLKKLITEKTYRRDNTTSTYKRES
ncbi:MAG: hypothetical protein Q4G08_01050 [Capnocytophaga sp.]|nr:hypothetical protein [Capnocytophaga sp.]